MSHTLILGATVLALGNSWAASQPVVVLPTNDALFPTHSAWMSYHSNPTIEAWDTHADHSTPMSWPDGSDRWRASLQTAILVPSGLQLVDEMHQDVNHDGNFDAAQIVRA
jgi:hypothetical protein